MPDKVAKFSESAVNILYVIGGFWVVLGIAGAFFLKYLYALLKIINIEISHVKEVSSEKIEDIEKDIDHHREMHDHHYNFAKEIKPELSELKADCRNIKENFDKIDSEHRRNH